MVEESDMSESETAADLTLMKSNSLQADLCISSDARHVTCFL